MSGAYALSEVAAERARQDVKWGEQNHPHGTGYSSSLESDRDRADMARSRCNWAAARGAVTWRHILEEEVCEAFAETDPDLLRAELIQVAAVATAWAEAIDRRPSASCDNTPPCWGVDCTCEDNVALLRDGHKWDCPSLDGPGRVEPSSANCDSGEVRDA
jgi:hypothetical protein